MPRCVRITSFDFDPSKYDSLLSDVEAIDNDILNGLSGLRTVRAVKTSDDHMFVMSSYESMEALNAASATHAQVFAGFLGQLQADRDLAVTQIVFGQVLIHVADGGDPHGLGDGAGRDAG